MQSAAIRRFFLTLSPGQVNATIGFTIVALGVAIMILAGVLGRTAEMWPLIIAGAALVAIWIVINCQPTKTIQRDCLAITSTGELIVSTSHCDVYTYWVWDPRFKGALVIPRWPKYKWQNKPVEKKISVIVGKMILSLDLSLHLNRASDSWHVDLALYKIQKNLDNQCREDDWIGRIRDSIGREFRVILTDLAITGQLADFTENGKSTRMTRLINDSGFQKVTAVYGDYLTAEIDYNVGSIDNA